MKITESKYILAIEHLLQLALLVIWVGLAYASFGNQVNYLPDLGIKFFAVTSGSMEPAIKSGSLIIVKSVSPSNIETDQIITFLYPADTGTTATHRVYEIKKDEVGNPEFITKGDANGNPDLVTVKAKQLIGVYMGQIPLIGFLTAWIKTRFGFFFLIIIPATIIILWEISLLIRSFIKHSGKNEASDYEKTD